MKYVYLTLNWVFGVLFGLTGLISLVESPLGGVCLIAISILLLPPVRNAIYSKTQKELPFKARAVSVFVLFIAFAIFVGQSQERKAAELEAQKAEEQAQMFAQARQENIDYFKAHKAEIISSASSALSENNYQLVMNQTSKYLPANDTELNEIYNQAKSAIDEIKRIEREKKEKLEREAKTKEILAKLKKVPASEFKENKDLYQQLVNLNPDDKTYQQKFDYYSQQLSQQQEKERKEQEKLKNAFAEYGQFNEEQVCIAGIATNNGRSAKGIRVLAKQGNTIAVAYTRDDGKIFGYSCQISGNEIRWRDQSMNRWNSNIKLYYALADDGARLNIRSVVFGEAMRKSFTLADF